jgi:hypothetical protein
MVPEVLLDGYDAGKTLLDFLRCQVPEHLFQPLSRTAMHANHPQLDTSLL